MLKGEAGEQTPPPHRGALPIQQQHMFSVSSVQEEVRGPCSLFIVRLPYEGGSNLSCRPLEGTTQHKHSNAQSQFVARPRWRQNSS